MSFQDFLDRAEQVRLRIDEESLEDESSKVGEGANTSAHFSGNGYIIKPVAYQPAGKSPHERADEVNSIDGFPWAEVVDRDVEGIFNYGLVRMPAATDHKTAFDTFHVPDLISLDIDSFRRLRNESVTYRDFKPENLGYFNIHNNPVAKPIDLFHGYEWEFEEELEDRKLADIMNLYITGTPNEEGMIDRYPVTTPEVESHIMNELDVQQHYITGDPYDDFQQITDDYSVEDLLREQ